MDNVLIKAWNASTRPFDGETLACSDLLPISVLRDILLEVVAELRVAFQHVQLLKFWDLYQHHWEVTTPRPSPDEYLNALSSPASWGDLADALASERSLYEQRFSGDDQVRRAFYAQDGGFLLRFHVRDEDDDPEEYPGILGDFDLTASSSFVRIILERLKEKAMGKLTVSGAKEYFGETWRVMERTDTWNRFFND